MQTKYYCLECGNTLKPIKVYTLGNLLPDIYECKGKHVYRVFKGLFGLQATKETENSFWIRKK
jgi:hypothetical protein